MTGPTVGHTPSADQDTALRDLTPFTAPGDVQESGQESGQESRQEPGEGPGEDVAPWYADGGRKTALGFWAGGAVLSYGAMQVTGFFADVPFLALAGGALVYFAVRGVAVARREIDRRR